MHARLAIASLILAAASSAFGSLTLLPAGPQLGVNNVNNLVANGSFEIGAPTPGTPENWATGTSFTPYTPIPSWQASGAPQTYAYWGSDFPGVSPFRIAGSAILPHGQSGVYFGNAAAIPNLPPTFNADRTVSFPGPVSFNTAYAQPALLWQSVPTHLTIAPSYILSFWVSGENAGFGGGAPDYDGIFGLRLTNVLAGDPIQHLVVPSGGTSIYGDSIRYEFQFSPLNPLAPVTIEFINWGHMNLSAFGGFGTTELILDDVIVNPVPGPAASVLVALAGGWSIRRRRAAR